MVEFHYYAIADGLATHFRRFGKWHERQLADAALETSYQLELPLTETSRPKRRPGHFIRKGDDERHRERGECGG